MDTLNSVEQVILGLTQTKEACQQLLQEAYPNLALKCGHTLGNLIAQLSHASGAIVGGKEIIDPAKQPKPTHFLGIPLGTPPAQTRLEVIMPSDLERTQLQDLTEQAFIEFQTMEPGVLKETYGDLIIRSVAVKAGMPDVTPTNPEKIGVAFIRDAIAAVKVKAEQINQDAEAQAAADKAKADSITETETGNETKV